MTTILIAAKIKSLSFLQIQLLNLISYYFNMAECKQLHKYMQIVKNFFKSNDTAHNRHIYSSSN